MRKGPYNLRVWGRVRRHQLTLYPFCARCLAAGLQTLAEHVDHITPVSAGGDWFDAGNLQSLCAPCHSVKTQEDAGYSVRQFAPGCDARGNPLDVRHPWNRSS